MPASENTSLPGIRHYRSPPARETYRAPRARTAEIARGSPPKVKTRCEIAPHAGGWSPAASCWRAGNISQQPCGGFRRFCGRQSNVDRCRIRCSDANETADALENRYKPKPWVGMVSGWAAVKRGKAGGIWG